MKDLFAAKCNGSSDDALYTELLTLFSERHAMMKQEAGKCCRKAVEVANTPTSGHGVAHKKEVNAKKKIKPQQ